MSISPSSGFRMAKNSTLHRKLTTSCRIHSRTTLMSPRTSRQPMDRPTNRYMMLQAIGNAIFGGVIGDLTSVGYHSSIADDCTYDDSSPTAKHNRTGIK